MNVKQISVFVENKKGRLAEITKALADNKIDISALSIADTTDFGILRLIVNKPNAAESILKEKGLAVKATEVIAIGVADEPAASRLRLKSSTKNISALSICTLFVGKTTNEALVILRVEEPERAVAAIDACDGVRVLSSEEVYSL